MFKCKSCDSEFRDGAMCSICLNHYDFPCAGITESGWRRLGDRKLSWRCSACKVPSPRPTFPGPSTADMDNILSELKLLSARTSAIPDIVENMKKIQTELAELKAIKDDFISMKTSIEFVHDSVAELTSKVAGLSAEVEMLTKSKDEVISLRSQLEKLNEAHQDNEQRSRLNNIEIKGVPTSNSENLFEIVSRIGSLLDLDIPKQQINYIARVPMRSDPRNKSIICSLHNRYMKENFVAAAKKRKITASELGCTGDSSIFVNDHLTLANKTLLNKTKILAKEKGFLYVWVKNCKILVRKNSTSPVLSIKSDSDLKKYFL
ncbi:uncharacterized protein LOC119837857 [Zerene cesonia]|uniref:uncharacterized protein LOC119837857 n=1 Tax=Zerene cesonia TaxID=33412 RepID=UPI0018E59F08|nr:uncharacterized protein LOC119837857 [Zerene cesonia]